MEVLFDVRFRLFLTQAEFILIGKALSGKLKPKEMEEAQDLNRRLLEARLAEHQVHLENVQKTLSSLD